MSQSNDDWEYKDEQENLVKIPRTSAEYLPIRYNGNQYAYDLQFDSEQKRLIRFSYLRVCI